MFSENEYQDMIAFLVLGGEAVIEDDEHNHDFVYHFEGDGWNEPFSESGDCHCGWQGLSWTQTDPQMSGRYQIWEYVFVWTKHIKTDVWRDDDEGISQDTNAVQA